jgi:general secretion pathway protein A
MYQQFYGLRELPFELTPNPKYLFLTSRHREALSTLIYGLSTAKGVTALIGEAGTGKTTLLHTALQSEHCSNVSYVYLSNPALTRDEFIEMLSVQFGLSDQAGRSKAALLNELETVLRERRARGQITALVIDEAQSLSSELLEEIRLLANSETTTQKLLPLVLAGQPELRDRLNEVGLRQLKQRVTLRCEITPFTQQETAAYIAWRIRTAGGDAAKLFTREAVMLIYERSGGIPRTISVICDNALLTGFGLGRQPVNYEIVLEIANDFDLRERQAQASATLHSDPIAGLGAGDEHAVPAGDPKDEPQEKEQGRQSRAVVPLRRGDSIETAAKPIDEDEDRPVITSPRNRPRFSLFGTR